MNPWPFVTAAWSITLLVAAALALWSWAAMRSAERGPVSSGDER